MSTLASKVDVLRGWPNGTAIEDSYKVTSGDTIYEGQLCQLLSTGLVTDTLTAPPDLFATGSVGVPVRGLYFVISGNDADTYDGVFTGKVVTLRGHMTVKTDKFAGVIGDYTVAEKITWTTGGLFDDLSASPTTQFCGIVEAVDSVNGVLTLQLNLE